MIITDKNYSHNRIEANIIYGFYNVTWGILKKQKNATQSINNREAT